MKTTYFVTGLAIFLFYGAALSAEVRASTSPSDYLIRNYAIELTVDNVDETLVRLGTLPGINLNSYINVPAGRGNFEQLVSNRDLRTTLDILHGLGQASGTSSQTRNVFAAVSDLRSEFDVRSSEHARLMTLLYEATTFAEFQTLENRLIQVIAGMEDIRSRLNYLEFEIGASRVHVTLVTAEASPPFDPNLEYSQEDDPLLRIRNAFTNSANASLLVIQGVLVAFSYISIPLLFAVIIGLGIWQVAKHVKRKDGVKNETKVENQ